MSHARNLNSTNGRTVTHLGAKVVLHVLEAVTPRGASAFLAGAFLRPPRFRAPASEAALHERAVRFELEVGGETLRGFRLGDGPAVLVVHGWGGRGAQLSAFAAPLVAAGCAVVGFDAPAHGRSSGRTASVPQFADAVAAFARAVEARAAIGHSMGAAALALAIARGVKLDAAVLVSPPRSPRPFFEAFSAQLGADFYTRERARALLDRRLGVRMADLDVERWAVSARTPLLVIHDRDDEEVPLENGVAIARAWSGSRLIATRGLGHHRILKDPGVIAAAAAFVTDSLHRSASRRPGLQRAAAAPRLR